MDIRKLFGQNLREARQSRGWSQEELGFHAGLHRTYISQVERGVINPSIVVVDQLARALGVRPTVFFAHWSK
ncbi:MAG: helix-turn-helix transcriptional regulator [Henriciella sp.]|nr:helix-turn-helix transcriptional regulator [Henriciella sp.]